jgi:hypothetical protein
VYGGLADLAQRCAHGWEGTRIRAAAAQNLFHALPDAMSRRLFQRRRFDPVLRERLIDEAFARYLDWLEESEAVNAAYGMWSRSACDDGTLPFAAYCAALDREEHAASVYRSVIHRAEQLFSGGERRAGAREGSARA